MANEYKKMNVVVTGIEVIDRSIEEIENMVNAFDDSVPGIRKKLKTKITLKIIGLIVVFILILVVGLEMNILDMSVYWIIFFFAIIYAILIYAKKKEENNKLNAQIEESKNTRNMIEYMKSNRQEFYALLSSKDKLFDYYLTYYKDGYSFVFIGSEEKDGEEVGKYHELYIDEFNLIKETEYTTFEITEKEEWKRKYKVTLSIPYLLYKQIKTWQ